MSRAWKEIDRTFFYPFILFLALALASFIFGLFNGFTDSSFIFVRPITIFQYSVFFAYVFGLLSFKKNTERNLTSKKKELYMALGFFAAMASLFEVLLNFFIWFSFFSTPGGLSQINDFRVVLPSNPTLKSFLQYLNTTNIQTSGLYPPNLNVASKGWFAIFFGALYWIYFVTTLKIKSREIEKWGK